MKGAWPKEGPSWTVAPIGHVRSPFRERAEAPRQARAASEVEGRVELLPGCHFEDALADLEAWEYLWLLTFFDDNRAWRPKVRPPRSNHRRGVFATRAPYRPNPIGLTPVRLLSVSGLTLHVAELDLLDGTPVLDIKPYVAWADAIPAAGAGWLEEPGQAARAQPVARPMDRGPRYEVAFSARAREQLTFLREQGVELATRIETVLSTGPRPHAYRRIRELDNGDFVIGVKDWRAVFRIDGRRVEVHRLASGFKREPLPETHAAFAARYPDRDAQ